MNIVLYFVILSCLIVSSFAADDSSRPKEKLRLRDRLRDEKQEQQLEQQPEQYRLERKFTEIDEKMKRDWNTLRRAYDTNNNLATHYDSRMAFALSLQRLYNRGLNNVSRFSPKLPNRYILDFLGLSFLNPWSKHCLERVRQTAIKMIHPLHVLENFSKCEILPDILQRRIETGAPVQDVVHRMFREYDWAQLSLEEKKQRFAREVEISGLERDAPFKEGYLSLWEAVNNDETMKVKLRKVKILIDIGADVNQTNKNGETPLIAASKNGHDEVVRQLQAKGAKY